MPPLRTRHVTPGPTFRSLACGPQVCALYHLPPPALSGWPPITPRPNTCPALPPQPAADPNTAAPSHHPPSQPLIGRGGMPYYSASYHQRASPSAQGGSACKGCRMQQHLPPDMPAPAWGSSTASSIPHLTDCMYLMSYARAARTLQADKLLLAGWCLAKTIVKNRSRLGGEVLEKGSLKSWPLEGPSSKTMGEPSQGGQGSASFFEKRGNGPTSW